MIRTNVKPEEITGFQSNSLVTHLGIVITEIGEMHISGKMPVDQRTKQPFGLLHGGASVVLAETLGSIGSALAINLETHYSVGLEINANHVKSASEGWVYGKADLIHEGKKTHIWSIRIENEKNELICISRLTVAILEK